SGNTSILTTAITVSATGTPDTTGPTIHATITPTPTASGWNNTDVAILWAVDDLESAVASLTGCDATSLSAETDGVTLTCSATNLDGISSSLSVVIRIDKTAPAIIGSYTPSTNPLGWFNTDVLMSFACSD